MQWYYHITLSQNIPNILEKGLLKDYPKVYSCDVPQASLSGTYVTRKLSEVPRILTNLSWIYPYAKEKLSIVKIKPAKCIRTLYPDEDTFITMPLKTSTSIELTQYFYDHDIPLGQEVCTLLKDTNTSYKERCRVLTEVLYKHLYTSNLRIAKDIPPHLIVGVAGISIETDIEKYYTCDTFSQDFANDIYTAPVNIILTATKGNFTYEQQRLCFLTRKFPSVNIGFKTLKYKYFPYYID